MYPESGVCGGGANVRRPLEEAAETLAVARAALSIRHVVWHSLAQQLVRQVILSQHTHESRRAMRRFQGFHGVGILQFYLLSICKAEYCSCLAGTPAQLKRKAGGGGSKTSVFSRLLLPQIYRRQTSKQQIHKHKHKSHQQLQLDRGVCSCPLSSEPTELC